MDKLDLLFNPKQFADAFGAVMSDSNLVAMESQPDATVWLEGGAGSAGAGFAWDHGKIDYRGNRRGFSISGLSIADVPAVNTSATGIVRRLNSLSDFVGNYLAAAAQGRLTAGSSATYLRNDRGVLIQLIAQDAGQRFGVSISGVRIRFKG
ncbi:MAG: hypothetical protein ACLPV8_14035 [Steroidobacteraceae bacterium]